MEMVIAPILFVSAILYVAYPFLVETEERAQREQEETALQKAEKRKDDIIATIKDIEMDFRMGKLSEEDYQALKSQQEFEAVAVLQEIDKLEQQARRKTKKS